MTHQIETNGKRLMLVEVVKDAYGFNLVEHGYLTFKLRGAEHPSSYQFDEDIRHWKILGEIDGWKVDFDCSELVESYFGDRITKGSWKNYQSGIMECQTKEESLLSKLKSQSIDTEKHYIVIELKNKPTNES